jgi:cyclic nucleotide gated channel, plant
MSVYKIQKILNPEGKISSIVDTDKNRMNIKFPTFEKFKVFQENHEPWKKRILDPGSDIFLEWKRAFLCSCILSLFVDPLFFYLPSVAISTNKNSSCMVTDLNLGIVVTCFRTFADVFYLLNMVIKFRTAFVSPSSRIFGRGELVMDPRLIARRYLRSEFFLDLFAALPLPQVLDQQLKILLLILFTYRKFKTINILFMLRDNFIVA